MRQLTLDKSPPFFDYQFPPNSYLGAKNHIKAWILQFIPSSCDSFFDAFGGTFCIAYELKKRGKLVIGNDFLLSNSLLGTALIENASTKLDPSLAQILFEGNSKKHTLMERLFTNTFFSQEDAMLLDTFHQNVEQFFSPYEKAIAYSIMCHCMKRKVALGHFANLQTMNYNQNPERIKRNPSLIKPFHTIFFELLFEYNNAIFSNHRANKIHTENILTLLPSIHVDTMYFDPPYFPLHPNYQDFYHVLETFVRYWEDKTFHNDTKQYSPQIPSYFDKKATILESFKTLFENATHIKHWLLSYNSKCYPSEAVLLTLLRQYKSVRIERKRYAENYGGKGSVKNTDELLFLCE